MTVIDLSGHLNDIRRRYPEYWDSGEAVRELQALWGGADCNDCGVFERDETIRIQLDGQKSWYGEVRIAVAPNTGTARAAEGHPLPSGTAPPAPRAKKPPPPASIS
jgi:hypothetical protein